MKTGPAKDVAAYIAAAPAKARPMLRQLRRAIRAAAPKADERISYRMPYYHHHGRLIYFAAYANHIGLYIRGRAKGELAAELKPYQTSKATLRFPIGGKVPVGLVTKLVKARVKENEAKAKAKSRASKARAKQ